MAVEVVGSALRLTRPDSSPVNGRLATSASCICRVKIRTGKTICGCFICSFIIQLLASTSYRIGLLIEFLELKLLLLGPDLRSFVS